MRQLNKTQNIIFIAGAILMVAGAGISLTEWAGAAYIYAAGAVAFVSMQMLQRYDGPNITLRRLRRIMLLSDLLFLLSGVLMFASQGNPLNVSYIFYLQYIYRKWVVTLLIAAIIQLYVVHRIDHELGKEAKKR